ncbi:MAG: HlyD family efflux transporter periplasmic adaptor subunit [Pseudomonadota bacterium]|nr:HlyD family efflux transporter periplasmic adaptor subunit [Pseudomonadota bacterium]
MSEAPSPAEAAPAQNAKPEATAKARSRRGPLFLILGAVVVLGAVIWFLYWLLVGSHYVSTDNAYVGADVAVITPQVAGAVTDVRVADTQAVKKGDVLAVIDPADAQVAAEKAEAGYGSAVRQVQGQFATNEQLAAQVAARDADLAKAKAQLAAAESDVAKAKVDLDRRQALAATGAVSGEELTTAKNAYQTAVANLAATKAGGAQAIANRKAAASQYDAQAALTKGAGVGANPEVQSAKAQLDAAKLDLSRTVLRAPIDGIIAKRNVQVGQRVTVGAQLMTVVPLSQIYVDANFKEVQLKKVRPGQPVELTSDLYGKGVKYRGTVVGFAGGTGSAFAVIPAQNATGNWIKVVQRLPIRIAIDSRDLREHPLRVGLSMDAKIHLVE